MAMPLGRSIQFAWMLTLPLHTYIQFQLSWVAIFNLALHVSTVCRWSLVNFQVGRDSSLSRMNPSLNLCLCAIVRKCELHANSVWKRLHVDTHRRVRSRGLVVRQYGAAKPRPHKCLCNARAYVRMRECACKRVRMCNSGCMDVLNVRHIEEISASIKLMSIHVRALNST